MEFVAEANSEVPSGSEVRVMKVKALKADDLFRPTSAIRSSYSYLFAGRKGCLREVLSSIELSGQVPVIYGDRGIGKSSLAWRVFDILSSVGLGDNEDPIVKEFDLDESYLCFWIECEERFGNIDTTLLGLLAPRGMKQAVTVWDLFSEDLSSQLGLRIKTTFEASIYFLKAKAEVEGADKASLLQNALKQVMEGRLDDPIELFGQTMAEVQKLRPNATIVIFIDELDRLSAKTRIGDLIKHMTGVRFVFVGVSETGRRLIGDHESVIRKIDEVYVPPLDLEETREIYENASRYVESLDLGHFLSFSPEFIEMAHEDSGGYPYLSQRFGYHAINEGRYNRVLFEKDVAIRLEDYRTAVRAMFGRKRPGSEIEVGVQIKEAVGDARRREAIVTELAKAKKIWISLNDILGDLEKKSRTDFDDNIDTLIEKGVIVRSGSNGDLVKFVSPIHRLAAIIWLRREFI